MTKEELKQEAEESFEQYKVTDEDYVVSPYSDDMGEKMLMFNYEYEAEETYLRLYTQGYLAGAEPRKKRIEELEQKLETERSSRIALVNKIAELEKENNVLAQNLEDTEILNKTYEKRFDDLKKENAELKCECRRCVYTDSPCILSDYGKDRNGICDHFKDVFDENAELKEELKKEGEIISCNTSCYDNRLKLQDQLTKAKEILKSLYFIIESRIDYKNNIEIADEMWRAEQFWKVEK